MATGLVPFLTHATCFTMLPGYQNMNFFLSLNTTERQWVCLWALANARRLVRVEADKALSGFPRNTRMGSP